MRLVSLDLSVQDVVCTGADGSEGLAADGASDDVVRIAHGSSFRIEMATSTGWSDPGVGFMGAITIAASFMAAPCWRLDDHRGREVRAIRRATGFAVPC